MTISLSFDRATRVLCGLLLAGSVAGRASAQSPASLTAEQWRADLAFMATEVVRTHANAFHAISRASFDSSVRALDARIPALQRDEIIVGMQRIVASIADGHTNIYPTRDSVIGFHEYPIRLYFFKEGLYVRAAHVSHRDLAGARVLRIGNVSVDSAYALVRTVIGSDNEMGARYWAPHLLVMPEVLHALGITRDAASVELVIEAAGKKRNVTLAPLDLAPMLEADTDNSWEPRADWVDARDTAAAPPLWLSRTRKESWIAVPSPGVVYAQVNAIRNGKDETLAQFADRLRRSIDSVQADKLVLDLRFNRGGNGELNVPLIRRIIQSERVDRPGAHFFVIMGRGTFSAAQFLLDDLEKYTYARFVGEPSGSRGNSYGDSRKIILPNSKITVRASIYYWQDWNPTDPRPAIAPHIVAEPSFAAYRANRDPAMDAIMSYVPPAPAAPAR